MNKKQHEKWLMKHGVHMSQIAQRKKLRKIDKKYEMSVDIEIKDYSNIGPTGLKKEPNKYTGKEIIGVAVMHKSYLAPISSKESAIDSANMRR
jgi:hypothetical protein